jgi:hypothetical protein
MEKKICKKCLIEKDICEYRKYKSRGKELYRAVCKLCEKIYSKKYYSSKQNDIKKKSKIFYHNNKETEIKRRMKYYYDNRNKELKRMKLYKEKNKEYFSSYRKKYQKNYESTRLKNDPLYRLTKNLRRRLVLFLQTKNLSKNNTTFNIIGCSPEFLKEHLEKQFVGEMSWDKMGKEIHIDHITPLSSAKNENEIYKLCHYTNLQPLWAYDNFEKGSKILS